MTAEPPGGWNGASLGRLASRQFKQPTPPSACTGCANVAEIRTKLDLAEGRLKAVDVQLSQLNATVDDQAAQIVALQATAAVGITSKEPQLRETVEKLQASDAIQRKTIAMAEAHVLALQAELVAREIALPGPPNLAGWTRGTAIAT